MSIILTLLMWYGIISISSLVVLIGIIVYDRIKYGPLQVIEEVEG